MARTQKHEVDLVDFAFWFKRQWPLYEAGGFSVEQAVQAYINLNNIQPARGSDLAGLVGV
jgi:hypothetical protein